MYRKWNWVGLPWILTSGLMQYQNDFRCYFFLMASKPFVLSEDLNVTRCSWICFIFSPLRPSLIKKQSMVTAGCVYILCRRGISQFSLSPIRHPHSTSAWFTRTNLPPTLTLSSHTWPWILWIFYCLLTTCFFSFLQVKWWENSVFSEREGLLLV